MMALATLVIMMADPTRCPAYQVLCFMLPWQNLRAELKAWDVIVPVSYIMDSKPVIQARQRPQHLSGVL